MTTKSSEDSFFYIKEIFNPDLEKRVILECLECLSKSNSTSDKTCLDCILKVSYLNRKNAINSILVKKTNYMVNSEKLKLLMDYFKIRNKIKKEIEKLDVNLNKKCTFFEFNCEYKLKVKNFLYKNKKNDYLNPIVIYDGITTIIDKNNPNDNINNLCMGCIKKYEDNLKQVSKQLQNLEIISHFNRFKTSSQITDATSRFFSSFLFGIPYQLKKNKVFKDKITIDPLDEYLIGPKKCYKVRIYKLLNTYEMKYVISFATKRDLERDYISKIINDVVFNLKLLELSEVVPFEELLNQYKEDAQLYLESKYQFDLHDKIKIAFISAIKKINLEKILPLLIDDFVEEIFLDSPSDNIYLNHQKYGRCRTDINFSLNEIERLKTFLRIYSGKRLDFTNPSIKVVIKNEYFNCRFAIDVDPIQVYRFALDIRKLNKNILNIQDLLKNGTLNSEMAAFLYFLILHRTNITTTGETDTGKTTLINALDLLTPKEFRKVYIENVIESLNEIEYNKHQLKYQVDSLHDDINNYPSKHSQIKNLLHRSPDIIYLGEILTKEEAEAMFHCLSAGLKGFQTIHSNTVVSLINRILFHFKIDFSCLRDLGIIVFLKKSRNRRFVFSISEINSKEKNLNKTIKTIFKFDPKTQQWLKLENLLGLEVIIKILEYKFFDEGELITLIDTYTKIFENLKNMTKFENMQLISFFDQLAYFSYQGISEILDFWESWKNSRGLNSYVKMN